MLDEIRFNTIIISIKSNIVVCLENTHINIPKHIYELFIKICEYKKSRRVYLILKNSNLICYPIFSSLIASTPYLASSSGV